MTQASLMSRVQEADAVAQATSEAFQELARRHGKEYREILSAKLKQAELEASEPVTDSNGTQLELDLKVTDQDGRTAVVERIDRRSRRAVIRFHDGTKAMRTAHLLTVKAALPRQKKSA